MEKELLRREKLKERNQLSEAYREQKSLEIKDKLLALDLIKEATDILIYVSFHSEVSTKELMEQLLKLGKNVFCPKVIGKDMEFFQIKSMQDLKEGYMGIQEPDERIEMSFRLHYSDLMEQEQNHVVMILPGAVFDKYGNRIGYGGGFYDRYLDRCPIQNTVGICFPCQMVDCVPTELFDKPVKRIITGN